MSRSDIDLTQRSDDDDRYGYVTHDVRAPSAYRTEPVPHDEEPTVYESAPFGHHSRRAERRWTSPRTLLTPLVLRVGAAVAAGALVGLLAGVGYGVLNPRQVTASLDVLVDSNVSLTGDQQVFEVTDREVATQQTLLGGASVARAASSATGMDLGRATVSSTENSDILTVSTTQATEGEASAAASAYVSSYFDMVATKQRGQLEGARDSATSTGQAATDALAQLDAALSAAPAEDRADVLQRQSSQRDALAGQQRDAAAQVQRLEASLTRLPVNIALVDPTPDFRSTGLSVVQAGLIGGLLGGTVTVLVVLRVLERRRDAGTSR